MGSCMGSSVTFLSMNNFAALYAWYFVPYLFSCKELKMLKCLNAQVIKEDNVSETIIILKRNKVSTMMKKAKADYYSN